MRAIQNNSGEMSAFLLVGSDTTALIDTVIGKVTCLLWGKFVHLGSKKNRKLNWWPGQGLGRVSVGMWTHPLRAQIWADLRQCGYRQHFPSLAGVPVGPQSPPRDGASQGREAGETRTDIHGFQGTPWLGDRMAILNTSGGHRCRANSRR